MLPFYICSSLVGHRISSIDISCIYGDFERVMLSFLYKRQAGLSLFDRMGRTYCSHTIKPISKDHIWKHSKFFFIERWFLNAGLETLTFKPADKILNIEIVDTRFSLLANGL